jgi:hypothetical protein
VGAFSKYATALELVQNVLGQLALPVPLAAVSGIGDETAQQMLRLLTWSGRKLLKPQRTCRWQHLLRTWQLTTLPAQTLYDLPDDWDSFEDLTGWNFTSRLPMLGPATDPQWQCLKARNLGSSTISVIYRTRGGQFEIYNAFSDPQDLRIDYSSRAWVQDAAVMGEYRDYIDADDDRVLFDAELMTALLKLQFLTAKGFDTTAAQAEYDELLEAAIGTDTDAPVLRVSRSDTYPLISTAFNAPDTGYGA